MTVQEVIERVKKSDEFYHSEENQIIIQALEEIEQYRALGTVEELKEAREKQVAKKPTHYTEAHPISPTTVKFETVYQCRNCHSIVKEEWNFCTLCGQAIDNPVMEGDEEDE